MPFLCTRPHLPTACAIHFDRAAPTNGADKHLLCAGCQYNTRHMSLLVIETIQTAIPTVLVPHTRKQQQEPGLRALALVPGFVIVCVFSRPCQCRPEGQGRGSCLHLGAGADSAGPWHWAFTACSGDLTEAPQTKVCVKGTAALGHFELYTTECILYLPTQRKHNRGGQVTWEATSEPPSASHR